MSGRVAAGVDINARVEIESQALAKAEAKAVVEAAADAKFLDKAENEAIAGAEASAGTRGEAKASKSSSFSASGDVGGYAGGKTDADATTSGGGKAGAVAKQMSMLVPELEKKPKQVRAAVPAQLAMLEDMKVAKLMRMQLLLVAIRQGMAAKQM